MDEVRSEASSRSPSPRRAYSRSPSPSEVDRFGDDDGDDDGRILSENEEGTAQREPGNSDDEEEKKKKKKKSTKPKGPVRRTMISEDMLSGRNGITKVQELFKDFEFGGKGREKDDLNRVLNKLEQWTHMLHPKHPFEQCLERVEFLGLKKKPVKTLVKRMRMGLLSYGDDNRRDDIIDEDDDSIPFPTEGDTEIPNNIQNPTGGNDEFGSDDDFDVGMIDDLERGIISSSNRTDTRQVPAPAVDENRGEPTLEELMEFEQEQARENEIIALADEDIDDHMDMDVASVSQNFTNTGSETNSINHHGVDVEDSPDPDSTNDTLDNNAFSGDSAGDIISPSADLVNEQELLQATPDPDLALSLD